MDVESELGRLSTTTIRLFHQYESWSKLYGIHSRVLLEQLRVIVIVLILLITKMITLKILIIIIFHTYSTTHNPS